MSTRSESADDDESGEVEETIRTIKVAIVGGKGVGKTSCLLRFVGVGLPEAPIVTTLPQHTDSKEELGARTLEVDGKRVCIRLTIPTAVVGASAAISFHRVDAVIGIFSSAGGVASLSETLALMTAASRHVSKGSAKVVLLCNQWSGQPWSNTVVSAASHVPGFPAAISAVSAVAGPNSVFGNPAFDSVLRAIARSVLSRVPLVSLVPRPWQIPSLVEIASRFIREHWNEIPGGPSAARRLLPVDLHGLVLLPTVDR